MEFENVGPNDVRRKVKLRSNNEFRNQWQKLTKETRRDNFTVSETTEIYSQSSVLSVYSGKSAQTKTFPFPFDVIRYDEYLI